MSQKCHCGQAKVFKDCCQPIIEGQVKASSPEKLMRSRYSAYCENQFDYILNTYAKSRKNTLSRQDIAQGSEQTCWLALDVMSTEENLENPSVTFKAYYSYDKQLMLLHEKSYFAQEKGDWVYVNGDIMPDSGHLKYDRNAPCFCGSGKKFKRCCYMKLS